MPASPALRKRITLSVVNSLPPETIVWDTDLKGFCARRQRSSVVSYLLKTRVDGRIRWFTIGRHGNPFTPDTARKRCIQILADPASAERTERPATPTFEAVAEEFLEKHGAKLKSRTHAEYQRHIRRFLVPAFANKPIDAITRADVSTAHASWRANPRAANHSLAILSKMMNWAEDQGYRPVDSNPCRRIGKYPEAQRERFLSKAELERLGEALQRAESIGLLNTYQASAIRLLLLTGARLSEILTLKWSFVDLDRQLFLLPDSKTGKKAIALNEAAVDVLNALPRLAGNTYVIVGAKEGAHLVNLQKPWRAVRALAGLDDVRLHDLRHTYASWAVAGGASLPIIGRQLGHSQPQTTQRYAHLDDDPVRKVAQSTGAALASALSPRTR